MIRAKAHTRWRHMLLRFRCMLRHETTSVSRYDKFYYRLDGHRLILRQGLYQRALKVRSAVPHPKIMGIIRECGGKMHMSEGMQGIRIFPRWYTRLTSPNRELERSTERLLRVFPQLRRGRISSAYPGAEVPCADDNAHGI